MARRKDGAGRRSAGPLHRLVAAVGACVLAVSLAATTQGVARADDDRDAVANSKSQAADHVSQLKSSLEGIDAALADVYVQLDTLKQQIPVAESALTQARTTFETATRQHQVALDQLESAQAEQQRIEEEVTAAKTEQDEATQAIAGMARQMYRGDSVSPVVIAMTAEGTEDISDRTAAAQALTRSQTRALEDARNSEVVQRNQAERQVAVTERIQTLESTARKAEETAKAAKEEAASTVDELTKLNADAEAKQKEWDAKKADAESQLSTWQAEYDSMSSKLQAIDAANRAKGTTFGGNGAFSSPLDIPLVVTSPFGYRLHPVLGVYKLHNGTDFAAACGTPVHPIAPGVVIATNVETAGGNVAYVNHGMINGSSWVSAYVHMVGFNVSVGQHVDTSSVVGYVGSTGYATGCHLHLTIEQNGNLVDPQKFL